MTRIEESSARTVMQQEFMEERAFQKEQEKKTQEIEQMLRRFLPGEASLQKTITDAMEYSLMGGGKRLRPMFMREAYRLFSGEEEEGLACFMAAMEMIHTYSLVHDDLPAMDNDDYRRGRKTTHKVYGEDMGILCGDALLNYAYETAIQGMVLCKDREAALRAMAVLAKKAGIYGMVGGQVVDVEKTGQPLHETELTFIYEMKTGALLEAALMVGAELAGASEEEAAKLEQVGRAVGMAFQIQDDILDVVSTTAELGKPVHSDERNEKSTYVSIYGMENAKRAVENYSKEALRILADLSEDPGVQNVYLNTLVRALMERKK